MSEVIVTTSVGPWTKLWYRSFADASASVRLHRHIGHFTMDGYRRGWFLRQWWVTAQIKYRGQAHLSGSFHSGVRAVFIAVNRYHTGTAKPLIAGQNILERHPATSPDLRRLVFKHKRLRRRSLRDDDISQCTKWQNGGNKMKYAAKRWRSFRRHFLPTIECQPIGMCEDA